MKFLVLLLLTLISTCPIADDTGDDEASENENSVTINIQMDESRKLIEESQYQSAIQKLEKVVQLNSDNADAWNLLGFSHRKSENFTDAESAYANALKYNPDHKGALEYQGELFIALKEFEKARANERKLKTLCPDGCEELTDLTESLNAVR